MKSSIWSKNTSNQRRKQLKPGPIFLWLEVSRESNAKKMRSCQGGKDRRVGDWKEGGYERENVSSGYKIKHQVIRK